MPAVHSTLTLEFKKAEFVPKRNSKNTATVKVVAPTRQPVTIEFTTKINFSKLEIEVVSKNFKMLSEKQQKIFINKVIEFVDSQWNDLPQKFYNALYSDFNVTINAPDAKYTPADKKPVSKGTKEVAKKAVKKEAPKKAVKKEVKKEAKKEVAKKEEPKKKVSTEVPKKRKPVKIK